MNESVSSAGAGGAGRPASARGVAVAIALLWLLGALASVFFEWPAPVAGSAFVLLAVAALDGPGRALGAASPAPAGLLLRNGALDAWACGVLVSHVLVVRAVSRTDLGLEAIGRGMVLALLPSLFGLAVAAFVAMRLLGQADADGARPGEGAPLPGTRLVGSLAFAALVTATFVSASFAGTDAKLSARTLLLHVPALLVLAGASVLLLRVAKRRGAGRYRAVAIALASVLGGTAGLVQALFGFTNRDLARVTAGIGFLLTCGFVGTFALVLFGRETPSDGAGPATARTAGRVARALLPLAALLFLAVALVLVMTPMTVVR